MDEETDSFVTDKDMVSNSGNIVLRATVPCRASSGIDRSDGEEEDIYEDDMEVDDESSSDTSEIEGIDDMSVNDDGLMNFLAGPRSLKQLNKPLSKQKSTATGSRKTKRAGHGQIVTDSTPIYDPMTCRKSELVLMS